MKIKQYIKTQIDKYLEFNFKELNTKYYVVILAIMIIFILSLLSLLINSGAGIKQY